jgi:transcription elongation factor GreA
MTEPTFLTPAAHEKLTAELHQLTTGGREEIAARIAEARSHGDLRENADYDAAKNDQGLMEARIRQLTALLENAEVRVPEASDTVQVGSVATVVDADGDELRYFVAPQENRVPGLILASPTSPVGSALLGASVGDEVTYEAPGGTFSMTVTAVEPYEG